MSENASIGRVSFSICDYLRSSAVKAIPKIDGISTFMSQNSFLYKILLIVTLGVISSHVHADNAKVMSFSADGASIVTETSTLNAPPHRYSEQLEVWDAATGKSRFRPAKFYDQSVWQAVLSPDGRYLVAAMSMPQPSATQNEKRGKWMLWDVNRKSLVKSAVVNFGSVTGAQFSPDGKQFAMCAQSDTDYGIHDACEVYMVETATGNPLRTYYPGWAANYSMTFSPDGRILALAGEMRPGKTLPHRVQPPVGFIQLWDAHTDRLQRSLIQENCDVGGLAFSPRSDFLVFHRTLQSRAVLDDKQRLFDHNGEDGPPPSSLDEATLADNRRNMVIWNLRTGQTVLWQGGSDAPEKSVYVGGACFGTDGRTLTALIDVWTPDPGIPGSSQTHQGLITWKTDDLLLANQSGQPVAKTVMLEGSRLFSGPVLSPDGYTVAATDIHLNLKIWDSATGKMTGKGWKLTL